jgi:hypothetical protein
MAFFLRSIFLRKLYNFREIIFEERRGLDKKKICRYNYIECILISEYLILKKPERR